MSADTKIVNVLSVLGVSASLIGMLPEAPGYNGSILLIDDTEAERISRELHAARDAVAELIEAASLTRVAVEDDCVPNALIERLTAALSGVQGCAK